MNKYMAEYRCLACNCIITSTHNVEMDADTAKKVISKCVANQQLLGINFMEKVPMTFIHNCSDGSIGIANFAGFKKVRW